MANLNVYVCTCKKNINKHFFLFCTLVIGKQMIGTRGDKAIDRADRWVVDSKTISCVCLEQDQCWHTKAEGWQQIIGFIRQTPSQDWWVTLIAGGGAHFQGSDGWSFPCLLRNEGRTLTRGLEPFRWALYWAWCDNQKNQINMRQSCMEKPLFHNEISHLSKLFTFSAKDVCYMPECCVPFPYLFLRSYRRLTTESFTHTELFNRANQFT